MKKWLLVLSLPFLLIACQNFPIKVQTNKQEYVAMKTHTVKSDYSFDETLQRLSNAFESKGMQIFAKIDHQQAATKAGLSMQPATVIVFGNPKAGTPLMQKDPTFALQLPLKVLVTQVNGEVLVSFYDTKAMVDGTKIDFSEVQNTLANVEGLIKKVVQE